MVRFDWIYVFLLFGFKFKSLEYYIRGDNIYLDYFFVWKEV